MRSGDSLGFCSGQLPCHWFSSYRVGQSKPLYFIDKWCVIEIYSLDTKGNMS